MLNEPNFRRSGAWYAPYVAPCDRGWNTAGARIVRNEANSVGRDTPPFRYAIIPGSPPQTFRAKQTQLGPIEMRANCFVTKKLGAIRRRMGVEEQSQSEESVKCEVSSLKWRGRAEQTQSEESLRCRVLRRARPRSGLQTSHFTLHTRPKADCAKQTQFSPVQKRPKMLCGKQVRRDLWRDGHGRTKPISRRCRAGRGLGDGGRGTKCTNKANPKEV